MLTQHQATAIAVTLWFRLGETALAAAVLRAHQAEERGDEIRVAGWRRVALTLERLAGPRIAA